MPRKSFLKASFEAMHWTGASHVLRRAFPGRGVIFCLHHVKPDIGDENGFSPNANLEISPAFLDALLTALTVWGYEFISLSEVAARLKEQRFDGRPFAAFTLDDGYADNLVHAMPVFKRHNCRFVVYVTPGIIDGSCEMWWQGLEQTIARNAEIAVKLQGRTQRLPTNSLADKRKAWNKLAGPVQAMPEYEQRDWMRRVADTHGVDLKSLCTSQAMTWNQVRQMAAEPLAEIGAHTLNHYAVSKLAPDDAMREIADSGQRLAAEIARPIAHFAYPYGNVAHAGARDFVLCREAGYTTAVTTRLGTITDGHRDHLHALPRVIVSSRYGKVSHVEALISSLPGTVFAGFKRMNVN